MNYEVFLKKEVLGIIIVSYMIVFVVEYIKFDQLGVIDNVYKVQVDFYEGGVELFFCFELVKFYL